MIDLNTTVTNVMKKLYQRRRVEHLFYTKHPLLAVIPKEDGFYGTDWNLSMMDSTPQGLSSTFSAAKANKSAGQHNRWTIPRARKYSLWELDNETIEATSNDVGSLVKLLKEKNDQAFMALGREAAKDVVSNAGAAIAQVGSEAGDVITLLNPADVVKFERDMVLVASANDGSASGHTLRAGSATVTAVDRDVDGTATVTVDAYGGTWADNDYLFRQGDFQLGMHGLADWLPTNRASLSTPFLGVTRSADPVRYAGVYEDGSTSSHEETIQKLVRRVKINGGMTDYVVMNPLDAEVLEMEQGSKVWRPEQVNVKIGTGQKTASIGFDVISFRSGGQTVRLIEDIDVPKGTAYALQVNTWKLKHLRGFPHMATRGMGNGGGMAQDDSDSVEFRARYWGNLGCYAPGYNGVATLPTAA